MPPDADQLRQRRKTIKTNEYDDSASEAEERLCTIKNLRTTEICIDGVIYDIEGFEHPGGDTIHVFGGNDVTVQYKMIHPYHTRHHLSKMKRVGTVADFEIDYKFETPFEKEIKEEVFKIVRRGREFGTPGFYARAIFYVLFFFTLQFLWVTRGPVLWLTVLYGMSQAFIGLNVQHDANHGAASKNHRINDLLGFGADLIGGCKWLWIEQHWTHHSFTNHSEKDPDSFGAEPMMLFNDYPLGHQARRWYHRFQAYFYIFVLAGYWVSEVFNPQVLDLQQRGASGIGMRFESDFVVSRRKFSAMLRILYICTNVVTPFFHLDPIHALGHILLLGIVESLTLAIPFSLSHNFETVDRDPTAEYRKTGEKVCWFKTQVETSCTYGGFFAGCLTGGLNFQVEHHLFPRMSSAWYPYIAPTVREICKKHGVQYVYYPFIWQNLISTLKYMNAAGTGSHWVKNPLSGNS